MVKFKTFQAHKRREINSSTYEIINLLLVFSYYCSKK